MIIHNFFFNLLIHYLKVKEGVHAKKKQGSPNSFLAISHDSLVRNQVITISYDSSCFFVI